MILYSFRRCPYAMRARLGLHLSSLNPDVREIILKNKPAQMLETSPKGTVPVLVVNPQNENPINSNNSSEQVLEESLDIFNFALKQYPASHYEYLCKQDYQVLIDSLDNSEARALIEKNDSEFKSWLDKYKYADRHLEYSEEYYREKACKFIALLESKLAQSLHLFADSPSYADFAIFPFVRQFAHVNKSWFEKSPYPRVRLWLAKHIESNLFQAVMCKYPLWLDNIELQTKLK
ncbi:glutathione S-transferase [Shewanella sp. TC10]|uniref:glutathione S-transferase n=1 Tax=Shewanella sp. TC10 TaxID=1419739 RepID=UPI00129EC446|nr:glutathione S-transferase [Shewanella sp. TC10]